MFRKLNFIFGIILISAQSAFAVAEKVSPELEHSLKTTTNEPNVFTILFALGFVIFLIYITGVIYSKLNLVGSQAVKDQFKKHDLSKAVILSTTQLGQSKNLHVIEVDGKRYLIGATSNTINLIKELGNAVEISAENNTKSQIDEKIVDMTQKSDEIQENSAGEKTEDPQNDEFDIHKKYL